MRPFVITKDSNQTPIFLRVPSDYINNMVLVANTAQRQAIPSGAKKVLINSTDDTYVLVGDISVTATVPAGASDGTGSELNPAGYQLDLVPTAPTHISVISEGTPKVTLTYYS